MTTGPQFKDREALRDTEVESAGERPVAIDLIDMLAGDLGDTLGSGTSHIHGENR